MNHVFGYRGGKATIVIDLPTGETFNIKVASMESLDWTRGVLEGCPSYGGFRQFEPSNRTELKIAGLMEFEVITPNTKKPELKKPKVPTVKASAARVKKATSTFSSLVKKIAKIEQEISAAKAAKERAELELKESREQLVRSASE